MTDKESISKAVKAAVDSKISDILSTDEEESEDKTNEEEEETVTESWKVTAVKDGYRGNPSDIDDVEVQNMNELKKLARSGKYENLSVTKPNGDEVEYNVEHGKLVEM